MKQITDLRKVNVSVSCILFITVVITLVVYVYKAMKNV